MSEEQRKAPGTNIFAFARDLDKEEAGVWMPWRGDIELLIAPLSCPKFERYLRRVSKPHRRRIRSGDLDDEVMESLSKEGVARYILLGWRNVQEPDGSGGLCPVPYSFEKALEYLQNPAMRPFYRDVVHLANQEDAFAQQQSEESEGN